MKTALLFLLLPLTCLAQHPLVTGAGIDWRTASSIGQDQNWSLVSGLFINLQGNDTTNWTGSTTDGNTTGRWLNAAVSGNDFTNAGGVFTGPAYSKTGPNGYYATDYSGGTRALKCVFDLETNQPLTVFIVATETCPSSATIFDCISGSEVSLSISTVTAGTDLFAGWNGRVWTNKNTGNWMLFSMVMNGVNSCIRTNGTYIDVTNAGVNAMGQLLLGSDSASGTRFTGKITSVLAYNRALQTNELCWVENGLNTKYNLGITVSSNGFDAGTLWSRRVVKNGGGAPSENSLQCVIEFCTNLVANALYNPYFYSANLFATDSITATLTPWLMYTSASHTDAKDPWVNHSFVLADLTVNGLKGDSTSKYLETGVNPSLAFPTTNSSMALYLYSTNGSDTGQLDMGSQDNGVPGDSELFPNVGNVTDWDAFNFNTAQGRAQVTTSGNGFYCGSRTSASASSIYYAKNGTFSTIKTIATTGGSPVTEGVYVFQINNSGAPLGGGYSGDRLSFASIQNGFAVNFTSTQASNLFWAVQNTRTNMGGGFR